MRGWRRSAASVGALAALAAALGTSAPTATAAPAAAPAATDAADQVNAPIPTLNWGPCEDDRMVQCATARVPLDYDKPNGAKVTLDLAKISASGPGTKLGTLFVNPGGPGGSSTSAVGYFWSVLGPTVMQRYDVVGIDPRGVGMSAPIACSTTAPTPPPAPSFPITWAQAKQTWRLAEWIRTACQKDPNRIVGHMSTADTARDMDLIRQAVGDAKLNYYGVSYGTYLGATYAAMFKNRVGRFVVDAVLDPVAWATGDSLPATQPFSTRLRSAKGAYDSLASGLAECDRVGTAKCAFAGNSMAKWKRLVALSKAGDLTFFGDPLPYDALVGGILGILYAPNYTVLGDVLQMLWDENVGGRAADAKSRPVDLLALAESVRRSPYAPSQTRQQVPVGAFEGVACSDTRNPSKRLDWWQAGQAQDRQYPWFGSLWTWASSPCARWPISTKADTFFGKFGGRTATPILVVGNTYDPATPYHGAQAFNGLFTNSRLLTNDGWGHGALENDCVTRVWDRYYATGALPARGTVCQPNEGLYD